jgi:hypothetical protein
MRQIDDLSEVSRTPEEPPLTGPGRISGKGQAVLVAPGISDEANHTPTVHGFVDAGDDDDGGTDTRLHDQPSPNSRSFSAAAARHRSQGELGDRDDLREPLESRRRPCPSPLLFEDETVHPSAPAEHEPHPHHHHHHRPHHHRPSSYPPRQQHHPHHHRNVSRSNRTEEETRRPRSAAGTSIVPDDWSGGRAFAVYGQDASDTSQSDAE